MVIIAVLVGLALFIGLFAFLFEEKHPTKWEQEQDSKRAEKFEKIKKYWHSLLSK